MTLSKEQVSMGFIEKINDLENYCRQYPDFSFLAHMPIVKLQRETTKCRVVFLSNLCQRDLDKPKTISHNQAIFSGPCLNQKLTTALLLLRFDSKLLCFDLKKAFPQIALSDTDQSKLLFFWFKNPTKGDFSLQAYRNLRLSFGLRCSPTILMTALFKILILDNDDDDSSDLIKLKQLIYSLIYMDNGAITSNSTNEIIWMYRQLSSIFSPYKFELQQFCSNDKKLEAVIGDDSEEELKEVQDLENVVTVWTSLE